ncbi:MAG: type VI secretion system secreted protein VgrG [Gammaproteobacteria bacterium]|jgi:type VI secretion system secreted protein VgrG
MAVPLFKFICDATGGEEFVVVSFSASEGISKLYHYEIEVKAPESVLIDLDALLSSNARFVSELNNVQYPVHGALSSCEEMQNAQGYIHYKVVLVPRLWKLSTYRTNEIYT